MRKIAVLAWVAAALAVSAHGGHARPVLLLASVPGGKAPVEDLTNGMHPERTTRAVRKPDVANVAYGDASPAQTLDLYLPKGAGPFPVVVYAHGGAFRFGDKRERGKEFADDIAALNAKGIAFASIDYRLSGEAVYPAAVIDIKLAIRWLRTEGAAHKLDGRVGVWGKSAGAYLALMAATTGGSATPGVDADYGKLAGVDDTVAGVVAMYPPVQFLHMDEDLKAAGCGDEAASHNEEDSPESLFMGAKITGIPGKVARASPIAYLSVAAPPALVMVGTRDCVVSPKQGERMAEAYAKAAGAGRVTLKVLDAGHGDPLFDEGENLAVVVALFSGVFR
jgi:acetyl esterase/lipase